MIVTQAWRKVVRCISKVWIPSSRRTVVHSRINGCNLLVLANEDVGRDIHFVRSYESAESKYVTNFISKSSICVDVGANVGYFTLLMAKNAPKGRVYAFEPIRLNAFLLRASIELNDFENVEVIEYAVGASEGDVVFAQSTDSAYSSIGYTERKPVERLIRVPMTTLDAFVHDRHIQTIDILKVDVEGAEALVLQGSQLLLSDPKGRPRLVLMELFDKNLATFGTSALSIVQTMCASGYSPYFVNDEAKLVPFTEERLTVFYNMIFLRKELIPDNG